MSDTTPTTGENTRPRIRFGGGLTEEDRPLVDDATSRLLDRLAHRGGDGVDAELSVKDRDGRDMKTTLEVWITGLPRLVATSDRPDLETALGEVSHRVLTQFTETTTRLEPKNNRTRRDSVRRDGDPHIQGR